MGYDIQLVDASGDPVQVKRHSRGGTFVLGHDIDEIWDESDAPEHSVTDRLDSMIAFVNDFHEFEHICKDRGIVHASTIMELYHVFIINDLGGASE